MYTCFHFISMVSVVLPKSARQSVCSFRWWQPQNSGEGKDVWAVDDIALSTKMYNTITVDFSSADDLDQSIDSHLGQVGPYCNKEGTFR